MTQVCQYYAHTFGKFKVHFHYESDPTFDRLAQFVWSYNTCTPKMVKVARLVLNLSKKVYFQYLSSCCSVLTGISISQTRYRGETLHDDWNP